MAPRPSVPGGGNDRHVTIPDRSVVEAHLKRVRLECDRPESSGDDLEVRVGRGLKHPNDTGYAKFLMALGFDPNWAGMLAAKIVEEGRARAATSVMQTDFARALRRLGNARLKEEPFLFNCRLVLEAMNRTELISGLFDELPLFEGVVFIRELRLCVAGDLSTRVEVARIARAIWRRVPVSRGPKLSVASAAHEYFLESQSILNSAAFTWSPGTEDFTDRLTRATREEFEDPDFSPVSARRRQRARL